MFVRPDNFRIKRDLRSEARRKVQRQLAQVRRDAGELSRPVRTSSGVVYQGKIASTAPLTYIRDGRAITEWRGEAELARIAAQAPGTPVVVEHPAGMLASGSTAPVVGRVLHAHVESGSPSYVVAAIEITNSDAVNEIDDGRRGLSLGYQCDLTDDGEQKNIQLDHLAVVGNPRCTTCSIRADHGSCGGSCRCDRCLQTNHPLFAPAKENSVKKPAPDPLTDMDAAERRARMRDLSATYQRGDRISPPSDRTLADLDAPESDDDLTSMEAAERRAFLRQ